MRVGLFLLGALAACASNIPEPFPPKAPPPRPKAAAPLPPPPEPPRPAAPAAPTADEARSWLSALDASLKKLFIHQQRTAWVNETFISHDTNLLAAAADQLVMEAMARAVKEARRFAGLALPAQEARMVQMLRTALVLPAPDRPDAREELARVATDLKVMYSTGKYCDGKGKCLDLPAIDDRLRTERDYDKQLELWKGWHDTARRMRPSYAKVVELGNLGASELGFRDLGELWRSRYDMTPDEFERETDRLWNQVKPLYDQLHCYVRKRLVDKYGKDRVSPTGPLPAHLLGNMWAQEWSNLYPMLEPYPGQPSIDITKALRKAKYDPIKMVKLGEGFYTSLGLKPLPKTFWERSMFTQPKERDVVCHASAWDIDYDQDVRIKMCIKITEEELVTIHHELGHNYYQFYYPHLPVLLQEGAHDGFHEAIGDVVALSVTPAYYRRVGVLKAVSQSDKARLNQQLKDALDKIAFLPFGLLIDRWRWEVFSGRVPPSQYNSAWWELRRKYQGVAPPVARTEEDFDAGAKYHVPNGVPYMRYFLARILQFQFHRAMCRLAGHKGPLDQCSVYGNRAAGERFQKMLEMGASRPWPDALEALTGERQMDAGALVEYFAPLTRWLEEQNRGQTCGWQ